MNYIFAAELRHNLQKDNSAKKVIIIIEQRLLHTLTYCFKSSKVYHCIKPVNNNFMLHQNQLYGQCNLEELED